MKKINLKYFLKQMIFNLKLKNFVSMTNIVEAYKKEQKPFKKTLIILIKIFKKKKTILGHCD